MDERTFLKKRSNSILVPKSAKDPPITQAPPPQVPTPQINLDGVKDAKRRTTISELWKHRPEKGNNPATNSGSLSGRAHKDNSPPPTPNTPTSISNNGSSKEKKDKAIKSARESTSNSKHLIQQEKTGKDTKLLSISSLKRKGSAQKDDAKTKKKEKRDRKEKTKKDKGRKSPHDHLSGDESPGYSGTSEGESEGVGGDSEGLSERASSQEDQGGGGGEKEGDTSKPRERSASWMAGRRSGDPFSQNTPSATSTSATTTGNSTPSPRSIPGQDESWTASRKKAPNMGSSRRKISILGSVRKSLDEGSLNLAGSREDEDGGETDGRGGRVRANTGGTTRERESEEDADGEEDSDPLSAPHTPVHSSSPPVALARAVTADSLMLRRDDGSSDNTHNDHNHHHTVLESTTNKPTRSLSLEDTSGSRISPTEHEIPNAPIPAITTTPSSPAPRGPYHYHPSTSTSSSPSTVAPATTSPPPTEMTTLQQKRNNRKSWSGAQSSMVITRKRMSWTHETEEGGDLPPAIPGVELTSVWDIAQAYDSGLMFATRDFKDDLRKFRREDWEVIAERSKREEARNQLVKSMEAILKNKIEKTKSSEEVHNAYREDSVNYGVGDDETREEDENFGQRGELLKRTLTEEFAPPSPAKSTSVTTPPSSPDKELSESSSPEDPEKGGEKKKKFRSLSEGNVKMILLQKGASGGGGPRRETRGVKRKVKQIIEEEIRLEESSEGGSLRPDELSADEGVGQPMASKRGEEGEDPESSETRSSSNDDVDELKKMAGAIDLGRHREGEGSTPVSPTSPSEQSQAHIRPRRPPQPGGKPQPVLKKKVSIGLIPHVGA